MPDQAETPSADLAAELTTLSRSTWETLLDQMPRRYRHCTWKAFDKRRLGRIPCSEQLTAWTGVELPLVYLHSPNSGNGKTHLACAMARRSIARELRGAKPIAPGRPVPIRYARIVSGFYPFSFAFENCPDLLQRAKTEFDSSKPRTVYQTATLVPNLILDELPVRPTPWAAEFLVAVIGFRFNCCSPTVVTSNATGAELRKYYAPMLESRLLGNECLHSENPLDDFRKLS